MTIHRKIIAAAIRGELVQLRDGKGFAPREVDLFDAFCLQLSIPPDVEDAEPRWVTYGRSKIGEREIVGAKHNNWIVAAWKRLGAKWFIDDETPWCGNFIAQCMEAAGLTWPKEFARAKSWAYWGVPLTAPVLGAVGVKSRAGGGHVFLIVGETADRRFYKALGGNQSNAVSIVDIAKSEVTDIRWPAGVPVPSGRMLPVLARGTIAGSEA